MGHFIKNLNADGGGGTSATITGLVGSTDFYRRISWRNCTRDGNPSTKWRTYIEHRVTVNFTKDEQSHLDFHRKQRMKWIMRN